MSGRYVHDGGWQDFPTRREAEEDARIDDEFYADVESFLSHYADEIDGLVVVTFEPEPEPYPVPEPDYHDGYGVDRNDPNWQYGTPEQLVLFVVLDADGTHVFGVAY